MSLSSSRWREWWSFFAAASKRFRSVRSSRSFVVVDSLSSLAVYNGVPAVAEWAHALVNRLRRSGTPAALMVVERQAGEDLLDQLRLLCDLIVTA